MAHLTGPRRALLTASVVLCLSGIGLNTGFAQIQAQPISRFNLDTEHWVVIGDPVKPKPDHFKTGGAPGGFVRTTDSAEGGIMYWKAPLKFLGDQSAMYGGVLRFDLRESSDGKPFNAPDLIIKGGGYRLTYDIAKTPQSHWTHFQVPLSEGGWMDKGGAATASEMRAVLGSLGTLLIRAEYTSHVDVNDLDTVVMKAP